MKAQVDCPGQTDRQERAAEYLHSHKESLISLQRGWQLKKISSSNTLLLEMLSFICLKTMKTLSNVAVDVLSKSEQNFHLQFL